MTGYLRLAIMGELDAKERKGPQMTEWYVYCENGKPVEVILGRRLAVNRLTLNARLTLDEQRRTARLMDMIPELGRPFLIVGWEDSPDRSITRVIGPGTEV